MINKDFLKSEIDKVPDKYLGILYKIIKALESPDKTELNVRESAIDSDIYDEHTWNQFIEDTYGCLSDSPIIRPDQGKYEIRDNIK